MARNLIGNPLCLPAQVGGSRVTSPGIGRFRVGLLARFAELLTGPQIGTWRQAPLQDPNLMTPYVPECRRLGHSPRKPRCESKLDS
ncbi:hypothetical protein GCM10023096_25090 [Nonomuraea ferruginea]